MFSQNLRGIAAMLVAVAAIAGTGALLKLLAASYPPMQVGTLRGAASLPFLLAGVALLGRWRELRPVRIGLHLLRGVLGLVMVAGFIYAVKVLSLADAYSIFFVAPLMVTAFAVPLLGERVDWRRWLAIFAGLAGVLTMLRPSGHAMGALGMAGALLSAVAYALSAISVRVLTRTDTTVSMVFFVSLSNESAFSFLRHASTLMKADTRLLSSPFFSMRPIAREKRATEALVN